MNYYPHHIGDYSRDTSHLSMVEDGAYRRLLDLCYSAERPLPLERDKLYRLARATADEEKRAIDIVLGEFFIEGDGGWYHKRVREEIRKAAAKMKAARSNGKKGGRPITQQVTKEKPTGFPESKPTETESKAPNNQYPRTKNQTNKEEVALRLPEWLPLEAWKAYLEVRKQKKTPNTPRALGMLITELERLKSLGHDPVKVLDQSTLKGWKSVYPLKLELVSVTAEPAARLCDYCARPSTGTVNGRRACDAHWDRAMGNEKPAKLVA